MRESARAGCPPRLRPAGYLLVLARLPPLRGQPPALALALALRSRLPPSPARSPLLFGALLEAPSPGRGSARPAPSPRVSAGGPGGTRGGAARGGHGRGRGPGPAANRRRRSKPKGRLGGARRPPRPLPPGHCSRAAEKPHAEPAGAQAAPALRESPSDSPRILEDLVTRSRPVPGAA